VLHKNRGRGYPRKGRFDKDNHTKPAQSGAIVASLVVRLCLTGAKVTPKRRPWPSSIF
jgi:hypothetical protein